jgi:hypothetical protein
MVPERKPFFFLQAPYRRPVVSFLAAALLTSAPLLIAFILRDIEDPFRGGGPASQQLDLMDLFLYGGTSRFGAWFEGLRKQVHPSAYNIGLSVYVGWSVIFLILYLWSKRKVVQPAEQQPWLILMVGFAIISLGRSLIVFGTKVPYLVMPYRLLEIVLPPMHVSGKANRQIVVVFLMAAVLCSAALKHLMAGNHKTRLLAAAATALLVLESLPAAMPANQFRIPGYVQKLKALPFGGLMDMAVSSPMAFLYQTIHGKPMAFGHVSRLTTSADIRRTLLRGLILSRDFERIARAYKIRYLVTPRRRFPRRKIPRGGIPHLLVGKLEESEHVRLIFKDRDAYLYWLTP